MVEDTCCQLFYSFGLTPICKGSIQFLRSHVIVSFDFLQMTGLCFQLPTLCDEFNIFARSSIGFIYRFLHNLLQFTLLECDG